MSVPDWVQDAIFYHIFPDRFCNGDPANDPSNVQNWGATPTIWGFQGGDLRGVTDKLDYILDLGANAIYFNPIFLASSNHRYNTADYFRIDPKLGTLEDFHALLDAAHERGMRVILDGVFNHCGRGFFAFNDILENQEHSPYRNWFHLKHFPVNAYTWGDARDYLAWWGIESLPKFNTDNPAVRRYLLDVARYWIEQGADGWRLDVPNEINDDTFWAEFRRVVKTANPEAYIVGEIWNADPRWVGEGHFDGLMNYPIRDAVLRLLYAGTLDIPNFAEKVEGLLTFYPLENVYAMYVPLGSHDTERLLTKVDGDVRKAKLAFLFQFAYPGAPVIYYGDEVGLMGGKDPECRGAFPWEKKDWNQELHAWVRLLAHTRRQSLALRRGIYYRVPLSAEASCYAFARIVKEDPEHSSSVLVVLNAGPESCRVELDVHSLGWEDGRVAHSLLSDTACTVSQGKVTLALSAWSGEWVSGSAPSPRLSTGEQ